MARKNEMPASMQEKLDTYAQAFRTGSEFGKLVEMEAWKNPVWGIKKILLDKQQMCRKNFDTRQLVKPQDIYDHNADQSRIAAIQEILDLIDKVIKSGKANAEEFHKQQEYCRKKGWL